MAIRAETKDAVTTIIMDRPERRNAVDGPSAQALADAFRAFEADPGARVAVLWGAGGTFCAGADLKAFSTAGGSRVRPTGDGPMGPTRMLPGNYTRYVDVTALAEILDAREWDRPEFHRRAAVT